MTFSKNIFPMPGIELNGSARAAFRYGNAGHAEHKIPFFSNFHP